MPDKTLTCAIGGKSGRMPRVFPGMRTLFGAKAPAREILASPPVRAEPPAPAHACAGSQGASRDTGRDP